MSCVSLCGGKRSYKNEGINRGRSEQLNTMSLTFYTPFLSLDSVLQWEAIQRIPRNVEFFKTCSQYGKNLRKYLDGEAIIPGAILVGYITFASLVKDEAIAPLPKFEFGAPSEEIIRLALGNLTEAYNRVFIGDCKGTKVLSFDKDESFEWLYYPSGSVSEITKARDISRTTLFTDSSPLRHFQIDQVTAREQDTKELSTRRPPTPYPHEEIAALQEKKSFEKETHKEVLDRTGSATPTQRMFDDSTSKHGFLGCQPELNVPKKIPSVIHFHQTVEVRCVQSYSIRDCYPLVGKLQTSPKAGHQLPVQRSHHVSAQLPTVDLRSRHSTYWLKDRKGSQGRGRGRRGAAGKKEKKNWRSQEKSDTVKCVPAGRRRASVTNMDLPFPRARFPVSHSFRAIRRA